MAKSKTTKKTVSKRSSSDDNNLIAGVGILFAGAAVAMLGLIQSRDNIKLLLIGFGAALLVLGGVLLGLAATPLKKRK